SAHRRYGFAKRDWFGCCHTRRSSSSLRPPSLAAEVMGAAIVRRPAPRRCWRVTASDARPIRRRGDTGAPFRPPGSGARRLLPSAHGVLVGGEMGRALLAVGGQTLSHIRAAETQKLQAKGCFEGRRGAPVPVVEAVLGGPYRRLRTLGQLRRDPGRGAQHLA